MHCLYPSNVFLYFNDVITFDFKVNNEDTLPIPAGVGSDLYESEDKMVSHPGHYQSENGLEVIDVIEAFTKDLTGVEATDTGNIIKYVESK